MDALSEVLRVCRLRAAPVLNGDFGAPWGLAAGSTATLARAFLADAEAPALFHLVLSGECLVQTPGLEAQRLGPGEALLVLRGTPHRLGSAGDGPEAALSSLARAPIAGELVPVRHGGSGARARIVSCLVALERPLCDPLMDALPNIVTADLRGTPSARLMDEALGFALSETEAPRPGGVASLARLAELVFIEILRRHVESSPPGATGWVAGLNDRYVGRALALMHGRPGDNWTVEKLARQVGSSRSALAERFAQVLGEPPIAYLSHWRLRLAAQKLAETRRTVESIASDAGYESSGAFSYAFKRVFGKPPSIWRKKTRRRGQSAPVSRTT
jgi:AraC-like DNA-binding protein